MQGSTNHLIGRNFWRVTQVSTDRWIGPNFKGGWRDLRTAESVRILKEVCRNPRTAESGRIFKGGYRDLRTTESVRIFETKCRNPRTFESVWIFEGERRYPRTAESVRMSKGEWWDPRTVESFRIFNGRCRDLRTADQFGRIWVILPNIFTISTVTCDFHSKHCNYDVMITLSFF